MTWLCLVRRSIHSWSIISIIRKWWKAKGSGCSGSWRNDPQKLYDSIHLYTDWWWRALSTWIYQIGSRMQVGYTRRKKTVLDVTVQVPDPTWSKLTLNGLSLQSSRCEVQGKLPQMILDILDSENCKLPKATPSMHGYWNSLELQNPQCQLFHFHCGPTTARTSWSVIHITWWIRPTTWTTRSAKTCASKPRCPVSVREVAV